MLALFFNPIVAGNLSVITRGPRYDGNWLVVTFCFFLFLAITTIAVAFSGFKRGYPRLRRPAKIGLISLLCIVGVLTLEIPLRIRPLWTHNELLDFSLPYEPSAFARHHIPAGDRDIIDVYGNVAWRYRNGYHSSGFEREKPEGEVRIVFLGGSHIWSDWESKGIGSGESKNWVEKIEAELHIEGYTDIKIINAAVAGHRSFDSLGRYLSEIHLFDPDYVFVCHAWNDMKYFWDYSIDNSPLRSIKPLTQKSHQYHTGLSALFDNSQIINRFKNIVNRRKIKEAKNMWEGRTGRILEPSGRDAALEMGLNQFELNLRLLSRLIQETSAVPVLLTQSRLVDPKNSVEDREKIRYDFQRLLSSDHDLLCKVYSSTDESVKRAAAESGALFFDMAAGIKGNPDYFEDYVHLSTKGGEAAAKVLADFIESNILKK